MSLGENEIVEISDSICKCQKLSKFSVSGKQLDKIPKCLKDINNLELLVGVDSWFVGMINILIMMQQSTTMLSMMLSQLRQ